MTAAEGYREVGEAAWSWVLDQVRGADGPWLPVDVPDAGDAVALRLQRLWPGFWDNDGRCCGAAGIGTFLLRLARVLAVGPDAPVVDRPDQWWGVPGRLRTVHVAP